MNIYSHDSVFLENDSTTLYYNMVNLAISEGRKKGKTCYYESHHILPKSLFPTYKNEKWNVVLLTIQEHIQAHILLVRMTTGSAKYKMEMAIHMLATGVYSGKRKTSDIDISLLAEARELGVSSRYEYWTEERRNTHSETLKKYNESVDKSSLEYLNRIEKIREYQKTKEWSETAIENRLSNCLKASQSRKGIPWSKNRRIAHIGVTQSVESNIKRSNAMKGRKTSTGMLGKSHSNETKEKMRESNKNRTDSRIHKGYWYLSPDNIEVLFCPIGETAKYYGLCVERLRIIRTDLSSKHKGWLYLRVATIEEVNEAKLNKGSTGKRR